MLEVVLGLLLMGVVVGGTVYEERARRERQAREADFISGKKDDRPLR